MGMRGEFFFFFFILSCPVLFPFSRVWFTLDRGIGSEKKEGERRWMENISTLEDAIITPLAALFLEQVQTECHSGKNLSPSYWLLDTTITKPNPMQLGGGLFLQGIHPVPTMAPGSHTVVSPLSAPHAPSWRKQACFRIKGRPKFSFPSNSTRGTSKAEGAKFSLGPDRVLPSPEILSCTSWIRRPKRLPETLSLGAKKKDWPD